MRNSYKLKKVKLRWKFQLSWERGTRDKILLLLLHRDHIWCLTLLYCRMYIIKFYSDSQTESPNNNSYTDSNTSGTPSAAYVHCKNKKDIEKKAKCKKYFYVESGKFFSSCPRWKSKK